MKNNILYILFLVGTFCVGQEFQKPSEIKEEKTRITFTQLYFSVPIWANPNPGEIDPETNEEEPWFLPAGLSTRIGFGLKPVYWIGVLANIGVDWKANRHIVVAPIFGSIKICPKINKDFNLVVEPGFGKTLPFGNYNLSGYFQKISVGIEDSTKNGIGFYIELCQYGFKRTTNEKIGSFSIGLTYNL